MDTDSISMFSSTEVIPPPSETTASKDEPVSRVVEYKAVSTDSMVTIRLSNAPKATKNEVSHPDNEETTSDQTPQVEFEAETLPEGYKSIDGIKSTQDNESDNSQETMIHQPSRISTSSSSTFARMEELVVEPKLGKSHPRADSSGSLSSTESVHVDWDELDKNERREQQDEGSDDSTAFLLARLEQENNALATDPKAGVSKSRPRLGSRPPSIQQLKKLVSEPAKSSLRYSMLPSPPPMTELEFWAALVTDYPQTAQRLPTLTSNKIRGGVPPPLRGVVWMSIAGARAQNLEDDYDRLCTESSPYEKLIGKDIGRSFPGVDMFRDPNGEGQKMLGKVLNAFSLWDQEIGYCQGLGFVVGPLLMHMGDKEAFCVLVRLMEHYDLRSCFLPDLSGLHLRIYQFQHLLSQHLPELTAHLENLKLEPLYLSQWFLSFFGVTCPLPMLLRIYDVILTEGASETLMRVALSLMRRNEKKILAATEFEDVMQLLISRGLWDTYGCNADDLVDDFCGLTGLVTREGLQSLETSFKEANNGDITSPIASKPMVHSAATRFLGRFWAGSSAVAKGSVLTPALSAPSRPISYLRRTPSKQSMSSTLSSIESTESSISTTSTEATSLSPQMCADWVPVKQTLTRSGDIMTTRTAPANKDKDLHSQIEDLLTALSGMQREQTILAGELQKEREEREEDRAVVKRVVEHIKKQDNLVAIRENDAEDSIPPSADGALSESLTKSLAALEDHFIKPSNKRSSILQTKHQLREDLAQLKKQYQEEAARSAELSRQLTEKEREAVQTKEQLREARSRVQEGHREKQRLEKSLQDLKNRKSATTDTAPDTPTSATSEYSASPGGLREFKLGRPPSSQPAPVFTKRMSSLSTQAVLATQDLKPVSEDALLLELVNAKTAEAVARQELEEVKGKLDSLRKLMGSGPASPGSSGHYRQSPGSPGSMNGLADTPKLATPGTSSPGFFSGVFGKRMVSNPSVNAA